LGGKELLGKLLTLLCIS